MGASGADEAGPSLPDNGEALHSGRLGLWAASLNAAVDRTNSAVRADVSENW
jgi:hypothetical protein